MMVMHLTQISNIENKHYLNNGDITIMAKEKIVKCEGCGNEFTTVWGRFCSKECKGNHLKNTRQFNIPNRICEQCGNEFTPPNGRAKFCSKECGLENYKITKQPASKKRRSLVRNKEIGKENEERLKDGVEDIDYVECKVCNFKSERIGNHLRLHNLTREEYKAKYPGAKTVCKTFSESLSGANNVSYQHGGLYSPFSKKFIKNYTEEQRQEVIQKAANNRDYTSRVSYYLKQGYTQEESEAFVRNRQCTFSLDICIEKYGETEGLKIWTDRQVKWLKSRREVAKGPTSVIEQDFFNALEEYYNIKINRQFIVSDNKKNYTVDGLYDNKFIIEFNGDFWHASPMKYKASDIVTHPQSPKYARDIWKKDQARYNHLRSLGYEVIVIWEGEYKKDPNKIINLVGEDLGLMELVE